MIYPWQTIQWQQIMTRYQRDAMPHALLLAGPEGVGKRNFARTLTKRILCKQPNNDQPCGHCQSCHFIAAGGHPDCYEIEPDGKVIKIEQIRELVTALQQTAQQGGHQIVILHQADALNSAAANALLKTLEEPAGKTLILLISANPAALSATIRSRCQKLVFPLPTKMQLLEWLTPQIDKKIQLEWLIETTDHSPLRALALANEPEELAQYQQLQQDLAHFFMGEMSALALATRYATAKLETTLNLLYQYLTSIMQWQLATTITWPLQEKIIQRLAFKYSPARWGQWSDHLTALKQIISKNPNLNGQMLLENLLIGLQRNEIINNELCFG